MEKITELFEIYETYKHDIEKRIEEFKSKRQEKDEEILKEFAFCTLTPQSKAKICWQSVENMFKDNVLKEPDEDRIKLYLKGVRFPNNKAKYLRYNFEKLKKEGINLKEFVSSNVPSCEKRDFIVNNFLGLCMKEASHFLRNTGHLDLAILDRHILRNLQKYGVIDSVPKNLNKSKYLIIEAKLKDFAKKIGIPFAHLDLLLWAKETREVFK